MTSIEKAFVICYRCLLDNKNKRRYTTTIDTTTTKAIRLPQPLQDNNTRRQEAFQLLLQTHKQFNKRTNETILKTKPKERSEHKIKSIKQMPAKMHAHTILRITHSHTYSLNNTQFKSQTDNDIA